MQLTTRIGWPLSGTLADVDEDVTAIYGRLSEDRKHEKESVPAQLKLGAELCDRNGWSERREYRDDNNSATNGDFRPGYARLLEDIRAGVITRVVCLHLSRLLRNRRERLEAIELYGPKKVSIMCVKGPSFDLSSALGRAMFVMLGEIDTMEVEIKSERQVIANTTRAEQGLPHAGGPRRFGFEPDGVTLVPAEAEAIKAAYESIVSGGTLRSIANAWNSAELFSGKAKWGKLAAKRDEPRKWMFSSVREVLRNPAYRGVRIYDGVEYPAAWEAIVTEDVWRAAEAVLTDPDRRPPAAYGTSLLSTVALCGVCGSTVYTGGGRRSPGADGYRIYRCAANTGKHIGRRADPIDELVERVAIGRLSRKDAIDLIASPQKGPDLRKLRAQRESLRQKAVELAEDWVEMGMTKAQFKAANDKLSEKLEKAEQALADAGKSSVLGPLIYAADVPAAWQALGLDQKRAAIRELMTVRIHPAGRGVRTFRPETVEIDWKEDQG